MNSNFIDACDNIFNILLTKRVSKLCMITFITEFETYPRFPHK